MKHLHRVRKNASARSGTRGTYNSLVNKGIEALKSDPLFAESTVRQTGKTLTTHRLRQSRLNELQKECEKRANAIFRHVRT